MAQHGNSGTKRLAIWVAAGVVLDAIALFGLWQRLDAIGPLL